MLYFLNDREMLWVAPIISIIIIIIMRKERSTQVQILIMWHNFKVSYSLHYLTADLQTIFLLWHVGGRRKFSHYRDVVILRVTFSLL
jgi:hypothetical protein